MTVEHQSAAEAPLVEARHLAKSFGRVQSLRDVSLRLEAGQVLALLGDNGAGKSTLIKILTGLYRPDAGELLWQGTSADFHSPRDAFRQGVATVYQDLAVVDLMSVWRNLFLGREEDISRGAGPFKLVDRRRARRETKEALARMGIAIRSADEPVARMSGGERQSIAIARGVHFSAKLLILDEPTSALSLRQTAQVLRSIDRAREEGLAVIVISHNVAQVHPVADRFVVLSHGESIADLARGEATESEVAELIVQGRRLAAELEQGVPLTSPPAL
jgi:simple sugar transport system ATP-binding protein